MSKIYYTDNGDLPENECLVYIYPYPAEGVYVGYCADEGGRWIYETGSKLMECEVEQWAYIEEPEVFNISQSNIILKKFETARKEKSDTDRSLRADYILTHNNGDTTLEQTLTLKRDNYLKWTAEVSVDEFSSQGTAKEAALKLADWMKRTSIAIKDKADSIGKVDFNEV